MNYSSIFVGAEPRAKVRRSAVALRLLVQGLLLGPSVHAGILLDLGGT
jgi:hypothetical protein